MLYCMVIGKMQFKTAVRYFFKPITMAKLESGDTKCCRAVFAIVTTMCCG